MRDRRWVGWLVGLVVLGACVAFSVWSDPPSRLVEIVGGDAPTNADEQWATAVMAGVLFLVLVFLATFAAKGLPTEFSTSAVKFGSEAQKPTETTVQPERHRQDEHDEMIALLSDSLELQSRAIDRIGDLERRVDELEATTPASETGSGTLQRETEP